MGEFDYYRNQLWTAPELLRMTTRPINGAQKADVYSFAIILQEIMFRAEPYFIDFEHPQSINFIFYFIFNHLRILGGNLFSVPHSLPLFVFVYLFVRR